MKHLLIGLTLAVGAAIAADAHQDIPEGKISAAPETTVTAQGPGDLEPAAAANQQQSQAAPSAAPDQASQPPQDAGNRSAIKVKPGGEAIKDKDLWEKTGYIHP